MATIRRAHGRAKRFGAETVIEDEPLDEKPSLPAAPAAPPEPARDAAGRVVGSDAARLLAQRPRRRQYTPPDIVADRDFDPFHRRSLEWFRRRQKELRELVHGVDLSSGVLSRLSVAAKNFAWGEFLSTKAAETSNGRLAERAMRFHHAADRHDWSAWTLLCRETGTDPHEVDQAPDASEIFTIHQVDRDGNATGKTREVRWDDAECTKTFSPPSPLRLDEVPATVTHRVSSEGFRSLFRGRPRPTPAQLAAMGIPPDPSLDEPASDASTFLADIAEAFPDDEPAPEEPSSPRRVARGRVVDRPSPEEVERDLTARVREANAMVPNGAAPARALANAANGLHAPPVRRSKS